MASWGRRASSAAIVALAAGGALCGASIGCGASKSEGPVGVSLPSSAVARFRYDSLDERPVSSDAMLGKPAVIAFVTTWDLASQAEVSFLAAMARKDEGRVGYAAVVLGERADREIAERYRDAIAPPFPMALADIAAASSSGFGEVRAVPAVVVLDARGRVVMRRDGLSKPEDLRPSIRMALGASP